MHLTEAILLGQERHRRSPLHSVASQDPQCYPAARTSPWSSSCMCIVPEKSRSFPRLLAACRCVLPPEKRHSHYTDDLRCNILSQPPGGDVLNLCRASLVASRGLPGGYDCGSKAPGFSDWSQCATAPYLLMSPRKRQESDVGEAILWPQASTPRLCLK